MLCGWYFWEKNSSCDFLPVSLLRGIIDEAEMLREGSNQIRDEGSWKLLLQPHNLLITSRPFKLSPGTSLSSYIAFSFSPNATHTHLAILLFSSKFLPLSDPGSGNPIPSEERLVGVVFDARANNVGVCVGSVDPSVVRDLGSVGLAIGGGEKLRSWVDYDASSKELEVRVQKSGSRSSRILSIFRGYGGMVRI
ncbi:hypothetical protein MLD38_013292 [Melastoma candidum]|uniref:Uncharacterized protein n=1 Tax=Melastoma candidum TaxID=119954 RepID=A0ACB9RC94_9MYRT|nr:hypothetical protein MLD38_013292 [Melastoma candidum]